MACIYQPTKPCAYVARLIQNLELEHGLRRILRGYTEGEDEKGQELFADWVAGRVQIQSEEEFPKEAMILRAVMFLDQLQWERRRVMTYLGIWFPLEDITEDEAEDLYAEALGVDLAEEHRKAFAELPFVEECPCPIREGYANSEAFPFMVYTLSFANSSVFGE